MYIFNNNDRFSFKLKLYMKVYGISTPILCKKINKDKNIAVLKIVQILFSKHDVKIKISSLFTYE